MVVLMVKIIKGNFGECRICDNMDKKYGLPSLEEKSWDLCLTDPPYNLKRKKHAGLGKKPNLDNHTLTFFYSDDMTLEEYSKWCTSWFKSIEKISDKQVITVGKRNRNMWYKIKEPYDEIVWIKRNCTSGGKVSVLERDEPILVWGNSFQLFKESIIDIYVLNGFLRDTKGLKHPCPKSTNLWEYIIKTINPLSVIDPFLGSGTTAQICEKLSIPWIGFEKSEEYILDIKKRIKWGQHSKQQQTLNQFIKT